MVKEGHFWSIFLVLFFLIAIIHSFIHFAVYGTGVFGLAERGVSGFSIGKVDLGEELTAVYGLESKVSRYFVFFEWIVFLTASVAIYSVNKAKEGKELVELKTKREIINSKIRTDIDALYDMLLEKKRLKFGVVAKLFNVKISLVESWAKTLESAELATVIYPRFGQPEILALDKSSFTKGAIKSGKEGERVLQKAERILPKLPDFPTEKEVNNDKEKKREEGKKAKHA